jgi:glycosyltransferase involved in cell wall biosynthesis
VTTPATRPAVFFLYRDSELRRQALSADASPGSRYSLYGFDEVRAAGFDGEHNLEPTFRPGRASRAAARAVNSVLELGGGYGGDFASVLASRGAMNRAGVVFSTVDTVGIPTTLLKWAGLVQPPVVYAAIGLPERLERLRTRAARRLFERAFRRLHVIVAYGRGEVDALREWLGPEGPEVVFVPFGVDTTAFAPEPGRTMDVDVVSVGADPRRDLELLLRLARTRAEWSFRVVSAWDQRAALADRPPNVDVELDIPFASVRDRLASARVVVLPVKENTYSGATTVLLQAMALGKAVVVSRTAAISHGYHLEDGLNCRLVPPGDPEGLERAVAGLLADDENAAAIGARARRTVEEHLTWDRYAGAIVELLAAAAAPSTVRA